jgi:hypothetical protein
MENLGILLEQKKKPEDIVGDIRVEPQYDGSTIISYLSIDVKVPLGHYPSLIRLINPLLTDDSPKMEYNPTMTHSVAMALAKGHSIEASLENGNFRLRGISELTKKDRDAISI